MAKYVQLLANLVNVLFLMTEVNYTIIFKSSKGSSWCKWKYIKTDK